MNEELKWVKDECISHHGNVKETIKFGVFDVSIIYHDRHLHLDGLLHNVMIKIYDTMNDCVVFDDSISGYDVDRSKEIAVGKFGVWLANMQAALTGANHDYISYVASN